MNKKKISFIAIVLTLCLFFGQLSPSVVNATEGKPVISISSVQGYAGETVDVNIEMASNPGVTCIVLDVEYNSEFMTLKKVTDAGILGTQSHSDALTSPYRLMWWNPLATTNYTNNGKVVTLTFELSEEVEVEKVCDLKLTVDSDNSLNADMDSVLFNTVDGAVTIKVPERPVEGVSLNKTTLDMKSGTQETLTATITPSNATNKNVTWKSSNEAVATVKDGVVSAIAKGNATITVTTEDGAKTATCAVTVTCSHPSDSTKSYEKVPATCTKEGHEAYTICNLCNEVIDGEDKAIPMLPHALTAHKRVEPTHTSSGNIAFWTCDVCGKFFNDADGKNEIKETDTILSSDPNAHDYTGAWETDDNEHWKVCGCTQLVSKGAHVYDNTCDTTCNTCGRERTIEHTWSTTYSHNEGRHWIECSVCHVEKDGTNEEHAVGTAGTNATCQKAATCGTCKQSFGTTIMHDFSKEVAEDKYLDQKATCVSVAVYRKSCTMCGQAGMDKFNGTDKDPNNHTGETELRDYRETSCDKEVGPGYTGNTHCKDCGTLLIKGEEIPMIPHVIEKWEVSKEATPEEKGEKSGTCSGCNQTFTVETDKLVSELKKEDNKVDGNLEAELKSENTDLPAESIFVADEVTNEILPDDKKEVQDAVKEAVKKVEKVTEKHKIASILDLKIVVRDKTDDGNYVETEHDLKGKVTVTVEIPKTVLELFENIVLLHIKDDGSVEEVPFSMNGKDKATFTTDGFSYYVFAGTEKVAQNPPANDPAPQAPAQQNPAPKNGDNSITMVWTLLMLVACASVVTVVIKKRRYNR